MGHLQSALSEFADELALTDPTVSLALGEIVATALQELIEAGLAALTDAVDAWWRRCPCSSPTTVVASDTARAVGGRDSQA